MDVKWTRENHTVLYKRIVDAFGPHEKWNGADYPYGARYELEEIYKRFAKEMTDKGYPTTWTAVRNQVLWGITKQDRKKVNIRHMRTFVLNKAAAVKSGLIQPKSLERWFDVGKVLRELKRMNCAVAEDGKDVGEVLREFIRMKGAAVEAGKVLADDLRSYFKDDAKVHAIWDSRSPEYDATDRLSAAIRKCFPSERNIRIDEGEGGVNDSVRNLSIVAWVKSNELGPYDQPLLLQTVQGELESDDKSALIRGKWEGMNCEIRLQCE